MNNSKRIRRPILAIAAVFLIAAMSLTAFAYGGKIVEGVYTLMTGAIIEHGVDENGNSYASGSVETGDVTDPVELREDGRLYLTANGEDLDITDQCSYEIPYIYECTGPDGLRHAFIIGGGLAGCECAIHLGREGKTVHLVEMRDELAPDANVRHRPLLLSEIETYVTVHTGCKGLRVTEEGVVCADRTGQEILVPGRSVICALGQRSRIDVVESLSGSAPFVRVIGDAAKVSTITNAVYCGYHAALDV